jgi:hypothetical protein
MSWVAGYSKRIKITIDESKIEERLNNFPFMVKLDATVSGVFTELGSNSKKLAIYDNSNRECPVEVEYWDNVANEAVLWTKASTLISGSSPYFYLYYDASHHDNYMVGTAGETAAFLVWDDDYLAVYHCNQDPSTSNILDSTRNGFDGTTHGSMTTTDLIDGVQGKALAFDGSDDRVETAVVNLSEMQTSFTIEVRVRWHGFDDNFNRLWQIGSNDTGALFGARYATTSDYDVGVWNDNSQSDLSINLSQWDDMVWRFNGTTLYLIQNLTEGSVSNNISMQDLSSDTIVMCGRTGGGSGEESYLDIEEMRVSKIERSDAWLKATYCSGRNQLVSFQAEESLTDRPVLDWANEIQIVIPSSAVESTLYDFPVLVKLGAASGANNLDLTNLFNSLEYSGNKYKIAITDSTKKAMCFVEMVSWNHGGETASLWFNSIKLSTTSDNVFYLLYDKTKPFNTQFVGSTGSAQAQQVWDLNYVTVHHFVGYNDSSRYGINASSTGTATITNADSLLDTGKAMPGANSRITGVYSPYTALTTYLTLEAVVKINSISGGVQFISSGYYGFGFYIYSDGRFGLGKIGVDETMSSAGTVTTGEWYYLAVSHGNGTQNAYKDAVNVANGSGANFNEITTTGLLFGHDTWSAGAWDLNGIYDEARVSNIVRTEDWIKATNKVVRDNLIVYSPQVTETNWLGTWAKRIKLTVDSSKVDSTLHDFPMLITLASGTGISNQDVTDVFEDLTTTTSGVIESTTKLIARVGGDESPSQHAIAYYGNPQLMYTGKFGRSIYFDGTTDLRVAYSTDWDFGTGDFTIDFWFNRYTELPYGSAGQILITVRTVTNDVGGLYRPGWGVQYSGDTFQFIGNDGNGPLVGTADNVVSVEPNEWHHYAIVRDGTSLRLFLDGHLIDTTTCSVSDVYDSHHTGGLTIARYYVDYDNYRLPGYFSEIRISKGVARWTSDFTPPTGRYTTASGIDSYTKLMLHFDDGDVSGNENMMSFYGTPQLMSSQGVHSGSFFLNGSAQYIKFAHSDDFNFGSGDFTIDWWENRNSTAAYVSMASDSGAFPGFMVGYGGSSNIYFYSHSTSGWDVASSKHMGTYTPGIWAHYAVTREGTTFRTFKNGELVTTWQSALPLADAADVHIGTYAGSNYFSGYISEMRLVKGKAVWTSDFTPPATIYPLDIISFNNKKIAITTADGITQCPVEIEKWDAYNEQAFLWTKAPVIYSDRDTDFYLYYDKNQVDNSNVGDTGDSAAQSVWDSDFVGVWHMNQDPSGGTGCILDSTGTPNNGTPQGGLGASDLVDGPINKAIDFDDASSDRIQVGTATLGDGERTLTIECMFKSDTPSDNCGILSFGTTLAGASGAMELCVVSNELSVRLNYPGLYEGISFTDTNNWHHVAGTYDGAYGKLWLDTTNVAQGPYTSDVDFNGLSSYIGAYYSTGYGFDGKIAEVRCSSVSRTASWIKTTYHSNWNTLLTFDPTVETTPDIPTPPLYYYYGNITENNLPVARTVRLYRQSTGALINSTTSRASDGYYYLTTHYNEEHFIVAHDDEISPHFNAKISDKLMPRGTV